MPRKSRNSDLFALFRDRYQMEHPDASPEGIESSKDFVSIRNRGPVRQPLGVHELCRPDPQEFHRWLEVKGPPESCRKCDSLDLEYQSPLIFPLIST